MQIERIEDKKFQIIITEKEALMIGDITVVDFHQSKILANHIGSNLLRYMMCCSELPHSHQLPLEVEL